MGILESLYVLALVGLLTIGGVGSASVVGIPFVMGDSSISPEPCVLNDSQSDETFLDDDCDDLANATEVQLGLDPQDPDTDDDGLDDWAEVQYVSTDPLESDTDGDGTLDGAEDPDDDGLTNAEEVEHGSAPYAADGDRDGLTDPEELDIGTHPLLADTDEDDLSDRNELRLGTDPLEPDSDGDGVLDGEEIYTTATADEALGVELTVTGRGAVADEISINQDTPQIITDDSPIVRASVTPLVNIEWDRPFASDQSFQSANVSFQYEDTAGTNESTLVVGRYDRELQTLVPMNTTLDREANVATGSVDELGTYVLFDIREFERFFGRN